MSSSRVAPSATGAGPLPCSLRIWKILRSRGRAFGHFPKFFSRPALVRRELEQCDEPTVRTICELAPVVRVEGSLPDERALFRIATSACRLRPTRPARQLVLAHARCPPASAPVGQPAPAATGTDGWCRLTSPVRPSSRWSRDAHAEVPSRNEWLKTPSNLSAAWR